MFGSGNNAASGANAHPFGSGRPPAAVVARLEGQLTQVLVGNDPGGEVPVFLNGAPIVPGTLESLSVDIVAPTDAEPRGMITGVLVRYPSANDPAFADGQQSTTLFPGTVEVIARGRRIVVTCREAGSFEGLWLGLGLRADGTAADLSGVRSLRIVITPELADARLVWDEDGTEENLFPE